MNDQIGQHIVGALTQINQTLQALRVEMVSIKVALQKQTARQ